MSAPSLISATHWRLVLASIEPPFDEDQDGLFLLDMQAAGVSFDELPWAKQGELWVGWYRTPSAMASSSSSHVRVVSTQSWAAFVRSAIARAARWSHERNTIASTVDP